MGVRRASKLRRYTWDNIRIGEEDGPVEGILSELKVNLHAFAVEYYGAWYFQGRLSAPGSAIPRSWPPTS